MLRAHLSAPDTADHDTAAMLAVLGEYVTGYHHTSPLTEHELAAIVPLILLVEIGSASWCIHGWVPNPDGYRQSAHAIGWIAAHLDELTTAAATPPMA